MSKSKKEQLQELKKLETLLKEVNYKVRYGKGNFHAGHCLLEEQRNIVINKLYSVEAKTGILLQIIPNLNINTASLSNKSKELLQKIYPDMVIKEKEPEKTPDSNNEETEPQPETTENQAENEAETTVENETETIVENEAETTIENEAETTIENEN